MQSEVFKIVPIQHTALSTISRDDNRAFSQIISDVVKGNNETEGYFAALRDYFFYDLSKVVEYSSPLSKNGLYSLASFKGGKIYAVGDIDNFDLSNKEAMVSAANEYIGLGYKVLLLVEAKNIAKTGLIEGKSNGIGLIVLQETVKENIKIMIENLYQNHCDIKVISGDTLLNTSEACRKAGIANSEKAVSISKMSFEQLELIIDQNVVFANASMSQKAFIVENLRKNGHKVAFVGDGDNDTQAMKAADLALAVNDSSESALMCSHLKMDDQFVYDEETILASKKQNSNAKGIMVLNLSQSIAMAVFGLVFTIFNLFKNIVINPFTFNHVIMWTIFGVLLPSLLLMFDRRNKEYSKGSFQRNLIVASFAFIIPILTIYAFQLINYYGLGFIAIKSDYNELHEMIITSQVANNLSLLVLIVVSMFVTFKNFQPLNTYRIIALLSIFIVPIIYFVLLGFSIDSLNKITGITTNMITPVQYFVGIAASVISGSLYLLILNIVEIIKGEYTYAKSKSRS